MVDSSSEFKLAFSRMPLVAILRGIKPDEVIAVADVLVETGFTLLEVPLNSPQPFQSIERLLAHCPKSVLVGAGTVLKPQDAAKLGEMGAKLMVTPNTNHEVITTGEKHGLISIVGCMTVTEALLALTCGAAALKIFPAARLGAKYAKDIKAVLPDNTQIIAVGGIDKAKIEPYFNGGYDGFGIGGTLYTPGRTLKDIEKAAKELSREWSRIAH